MFVWSIVGDHVVLPYSIIGLVMVLYVTTNVSLFFPSLFYLLLLWLFVLCFVRDERSLVLGLV